LDHKRVDSSVAALDSLRYERTFRAAFGD